MDYYAKIYHEYYHDEKLDLKNPLKYVEKIQWLKVYFHPPILHQLVDKFAVRKYVEEKIGVSYLNELYQVCDYFDDIDFNALPEKFVVKGTHGSNMHMIVKDKRALNKRKLKYNVWKWKRKNLYYNSGQEWAYKHVEPRIIIEKYLEDDHGELIDFKFFSFTGEIKFIQAHKQINGKKYLSHYDLDWNKLDAEYICPSVAAYKGEVERPKNLSKMVELASKLGDRLPFVRVDLYEVNDCILFGELTFYPGDGRYNFYPESFNKKVADAVILPTIPAGKEEIITI